MTPLGTWPVLDERRGPWTVAGQAASKIARTAKPRAIVPPTMPIAHFHGRTFAKIVAR